MPYLKHTTKIQSKQPTDSAPYTHLIPKHLSHMNRFPTPLAAPLATPLAAPLATPLAAPLASPLAALLAALVVLLPIAFPHFAGAQTGWAEPFPNGVVSSAEVNASQIGVQIMQQGGNAVDAAVAVQFALAVTLPRAGNIGGGGFMVVRLADGEVNTLDFREKAPLKAHRDMYVNWRGKIREGESTIGHKAAGVPGTVDGMVRALERYGRLPLETVMAPAIRLAREGYPLSHSQAQSLNSVEDLLSRFEGSKKAFLHPEGRQWQRGDLFRQPDLALTLERISKEGRSGFYDGPVAALIVEEMRRGDGLISLQDLREYRSIWRDPIRVETFGHEFIMMGPPSSGGVAFGQVLRALEHVGIDTLRTNPMHPQSLQAHSSQILHLYTETFRRAFADRAHFLGDPDVVDVPVHNLLSKEYATRRMADFSATRSTPSSSISHGTPSQLALPEESFETTHFSIIDAQGNAVAVTTTLNGSFGNYVTVDGAGFLLNNEMDDFSIKPGEPNMFGLIGAEANAIQPGKRMLSSMTPTIVTKNGRTVLINGAAGGPRIITATIQTSLNVLLFGMNIQQSLQSPRIHHQWLPDELLYESPGLSTDTRIALEAMGHTLSPRSGLARVHAIHIGADGLRHGAVDPGGDGTVAGY